MLVAPGHTSPGLDPHVEATVIEPFIAWLQLDREHGGAGMDRGRARQTASPLRQLLRERPADELARIPPEDLWKYSAHANRTKATGKSSRSTLRFFRESRGCR